LTRRGNDALVKLLSLCVFRRLSAAVTHSVTGLLQKHKHRWEMHMYWEPF